MPLFRMFTRLRHCQMLVMEVEENFQKEGIRKYPPHYTVKVSSYQTLINLIYYGQGYVYTPQYTSADQYMECLDASYS